MSEREAPKVRPPLVPQWPPTLDASTRLRVSACTLNERRAVLDTTGPPRTCVPQAASKTPLRGSAPRHRPRHRATQPLRPRLHREPRHRWTGLRIQAELAPKPGRRMDTRILFGYFTSPVFRIRRLAPACIQYLDTVCGYLTPSPYMLASLRAQTRHTRGTQTHKARHVSTRPVPVWRPSQTPHPLSPGMLNRTCWHVLQRGAILII
jgi:hypothetical protein